MSKELDRIKLRNPSLRPRVTLKEKAKMNQGSSGIAGVLDGLKGKIDILNGEIKADEKGKKDFEDELKKLNIKRDDIMFRLKKSRDWLNHFDTDIGPFERTYAEMTDQMGDRYDIAKAEHAKGLQVLMDQFQYHPQFKRYNDEFTAVPFRPK